MIAYRHASCCLPLLLALAPVVPSVLADSGDHLLIHRDRPARRIHLVELDDRELVHLEENAWITVSLDECIALLDTRPTGARLAQGMLILADGQRFPGEPVHERNPTPDILTWDHQWLGPLDVSLDLIESVIFRVGARAPVARGRDVVMLANGDRLEGFVVSLNDPVSIEVDVNDGTELVQVQWINVAAVAIITTRTPATGRRVWFDDGTVMDVDSIQVGDDGFVRLTSHWHGAGSTPPVVKLSLIDSILLDPNGMLPLALIKPDRVQGPDTRYQLPDPVIVRPEASLGLSPIEYHGPIVVRYLLPPTAHRLAAEAMVPADAQVWADFELIIRCDDDIVFRHRFDAHSHHAVINVPLSGAELTIELTVGAYGPIQDRLRLDLPLLLLDHE